MTPQEQDESARILREQWQSTLSRVGDQNARKMFWGAKLSLTGRSSLNDQTRYDLLAVYRQVEQEVFGSIQEVPGEKGLLEVARPSNAGSGSATPKAGSPPVTAPPFTS